MLDEQQSPTEPGPPSTDDPSSPADAAPGGATDPPPPPPALQDFGLEYDFRGAEPDNETAQLIERSDD